VSDERNKTRPKTWKRNTFWLEGWDAYKNGEKLEFQVFHDVKDVLFNLTIKTI